MVDAKDDDDEESSSPTDADSVVSQERTVQKILFHSSTFDVFTTVAPASAIVSATKRKRRDKNLSTAMQGGNKSHSSNNTNGRSNIHFNRSCHKAQVEPETTDALDIIALLRVDDSYIKDCLLDPREGQEESYDDDDDGWGMRWGTNYKPKLGRKTGTMMHARNP
jgi:hypothetical protein